MREMYRTEAANNVKTELVLDEIIKQEKVEADDKDIDGMLTEYASAMNQTLDELKATLGESQKEYFAHRSQLNKVLDMLWDSAKVKTVKEEKKPAKAATKKADGEKAEKTVAKKTTKKAEKAADEAKETVKEKAEEAKEAVKEKTTAAKSAAKSAAKAKENAKKAKEAEQPEA